MQSSRRLVLATVLALATGCAPAAPAGLSDADRAAIRKAEDQWVKLTLAKDWKAAAETYWTADGAALPPNGPPSNGQAAIAKWLAEFPPFTEFTLSDVTVDGRGDMAYVHGRYALTFNSPGAPAPIKDQGKHVTIFKKQADGSWKASVGIFNSDLPIPAPAKK